MTDNPIPRLQSILEFKPIIDALERSWLIDPRVISLSVVQEALQALYEAGAMPMIARETPAFVWYWHGPGHDHWMVIEEATDDALIWVAPKKVWPHSEWLLLRTAALRRSVLFVDRGWTQMPGREYIAIREKRQRLARWLSEQEHQLTHMAIFEGEAQGLYDRICIEHEAGIPLPTAFCVVENHWEIAQDFPHRQAPYVRDLPRPWGYQRMEHWIP